MKKIIAILCAVSCILTTWVCAFAENTDAPYDAVSASDLPKIEKPLVIPGTTPPPENALSLMADIPEEAVDVSTQIYENILNCDPALFLRTDAGLLNLSDWRSMSMDELDYVKNLSDSLLNKYNTADEKIRAVAEYVATHVYYDYDYYYNQDAEYANLNLTPYEVLTNGYTVCAGYSAASSALLQAADIPCVYIHSPDHAWNMAYNGERWILFDATWMSGNKYENGQKQSGTMSADWFDFSLDTANREANHLILSADYTLYNDTLTQFPIYTRQKSFTVPETVKHFEDYVFFECGNSLTLTISGKPETVGYAAFYFCDALDGTVNLEQAKTIEDFAFCGCVGLDNIVSFKSAETIGESAFYGCEKITGEAQFYQLKTVGDYAFYGCRSLGGEWHLKNLVSVGRSAFYQCSGIGGVLHTVHLESAGEYAFYECSSTQNIVLGDRLTFLPKAFLYHCSSAKDVVLPKAVTSVDEFVFSYMPALKHIYYTGTKDEFNQITFSDNNPYINRVDIIYDYVPHPVAQKGNNGMVTVTFEGVPDEETVMFCEFEGNHFLGVKSLPLQTFMTFYADYKKTDNIRIFVFSDMMSFAPAATAEKIPN